MDIFKSVASGMAVTVAAALAHANAAPLSFVNVRSPSLSCLLHVDCLVQVTDTVDTFATIVLPAPVWTGTARLQTRTFKATVGTPAVSRLFYEYRVDLTEAVSDGEVPCVTDLSIDFGPVAKLPYNATGPLDDVFVIFQAGTTSVGLYAVDQTDGVITFTFNQPICAGPTPGSGHASRFFGLSSAFPPRAIDATVSVPGLDPVAVRARAPAYHRQ
jgi:hypothetical protein